MKTCFLLLVAILTSLAFTGCVFMNDEDKEFYGKGWIHPSELDDVAPKHDPTAAAVGDPRVTATSSAPTQQSSPEWIVPETSDNRQ